MRHVISRNPQFYVTAPQECPYLENQVERKLFTALYGSNSEKLNNSLSKQGFRRSQNVLYRPSCSSCCACLSARIPVSEFSLSKSQKRTIKANTDLSRIVKDPIASDEQFLLFNKYIKERHANGGMSEMDCEDFSAMIEETNVNSKVVEYYQSNENGKKLLSLSLIDILDDGISMVYSIFEPGTEKRSLGKYMILDQIELARELKLDHVYLGYWVEGSPKMDYKKEYKPLEVFKDNTWKSTTNLSLEPSADKKYFESQIVPDPIYLPEE